MRVVWMSSALHVIRFVRANNLDVCTQKDFTLTLSLVSTIVYCARVLHTPQRGCSDTIRAYR